MQLNTALKNIFIGSNFIIFIMIFAIVTLIQYDNFFSFRISKYTFFMLLFLIVLLIISFFNSQKNIQLSVFLSFLIFYLIALNSNYGEKLDFYYFGRILFYLSSFISIVIFYQATNGFKELPLGYENTGKLWLSEGGDPITLSRALVINIITILFYKKKNITEVVFSSLIFGSSIVGLFSFSNRSTIFCTFLLILIKMLFYSKKNKNIVLSIMFVLCLYPVINKIPYFEMKINSFYNGSIEGIKTLFFQENGRADSSALTRITVFNQAKENLKNANSIIKYFFGMGFNGVYLDRPLVQSFYDLGFFGGVIYLFYLVYIPVKYFVLNIHKKFEFNMAWIYVVMMTVQNFFDQFITGLPYYYYLWTPTIFILFCISNSYKPPAILKE